MGQVDIERLYRILARYQELDPAIARRILKRILEILQDRRKEQYIRYADREEESAGEDEWTR